jgi:MFS transporter, PPP family, 3-phenylpropionic acid transporter
MESASRREIGDLNWTYVLVGGADATLLPYIPLYLAQRGLSAPAIGLVLALTAAATFTTGLAWAYLADRRFSPERMVLAASVAAAAVSLLLPISNNAAMISGVIVALAVARSPFMLLDPIVLKKLRVAPRTDYARIRLRMSAGWAVAAVASGALFQSTGLRLIPFIYAPLSLLLGIWVFRVLKPSHEARMNDARLQLPVRRVPLALITFLVGCLLLGVSLAATQNFLVLQINFLGGGALLIGAAAAFQAVTEIPTMGYTHVLTKYLSHRSLFAIGCAIYLAIYVGWAFTGAALVAALLKLVAGVAFALTLVAAVMIANDLSPARLRATGQALMRSVLFGVAPILGALGGGVVYGAYGSRAMFLGSTAVVAAAGLIALIAVPLHGTRPAVTDAAPVSPELATPRA